MIAWLRRQLTLPQYAEGFDQDDPRTTEMRRDIILGKPFLRRLYEEWYGVMRESLRDTPPGKRLEIGSGAGFIKQVIPEVITSDVLPLAGSDMTFSAECLPFADGELSAILMIDVLHHLPDPAQFFREAERVLRPGGKIIMIEPAMSAWGRLIYTRLHHEPVDLAGDWRLPPGGPLSMANSALPWIIFNRDRQRFDREFPTLRVRRLRLHTPLRYLFSGGVSLRALAPAWSFGGFRLLEKWLRPLAGVFSMFQTIEVVKVG
jgi:SAM-dependent methyltransferase